MEQLAASARRVAFFGGSFDPPHLGHLAVARAARDALGLNAVLFAPVGAQPLKPFGSTASFAQRLEMTRLAVSGEPDFTVSLADAPRPSGKPNYTLETLVRLRAELPPGSSLFCLMGADSFAGLRRWHRSAEIPFAAPLIVASRPSESLARLDDLRSLLPEGLTFKAAPGNRELVAGVELRTYVLGNALGAEAPFYLLPGLEVEISASRIRESIRKQASASAGSKSAGRELLAPCVVDYIRSHRLYR